jgi:hypothetical protein
LALVVLLSEIGSLDANYFAGRVRATNKKDPRTDLKVGHYKNKSGLGDGTMLPRWGARLRRVLRPYKGQANPRKSKPKTQVKNRTWGTQEKEETQDPGKKPNLGHPKTRKKKPKSGPPPSCGGQAEGGPYKIACHTKATWARSARRVPR